MKGIKCLDCDEYRNEWCEKIVDSPHPDIIRDCQYWHKKKDMVEVIRCKDCKYNYGLTHGGEFNPNDIVCEFFDTDGMQYCDFCSYAERWEE